MRLLFIITFCLLLPGCSQVFQPNTKEMKLLLAEYDNYHIKKYGTDHREETQKIDELFRDIGFVYPKEGSSYRVVLYVFTWNLSASEGARHMTNKLLIYKNHNYVTDYYLEFYPEKIQVKENSKVVWTDEYGKTHVLDFTEGLPE